MIRTTMLRPPILREHHPKKLIFAVDVVVPRGQVDALSV
jgi:hypothetical protein